MTETFLQTTEDVKMLEMENDLTALLTSLKSMPKEPMQVEAMKAVGRIVSSEDYHFNVKRAVVDLIAILDSNIESIGVRLEAAKSLALVVDGRPSSGVYVSTFVEPFIESLVKRNDPISVNILFRFIRHRTQYLPWLEAQVEAVRALGKIGSEEAFKMLTTIVNHRMTKGLSRVIPIEAVKALRKINKPGSIETILQSLTIDKYSLEVIKILGSWGSPVAKERLTEFSNLKISKDSKRFELARSIEKEANRALRSIAAKAN